MSEITADLIKPTNRAHTHVLVGKSIPSDSHKGEGDNFFSVVEFPDSERTITFFVKQLNPDVIALHPEASLDQQSEKWNRLHANNLPVTTTFRIDEENNRIYMTDVTEGGIWTIYDRHHPLPEQLRDTLPNLDSIKTSIRTYATEAFEAGHGVFLSIDAFAILVNANNELKIMLLDLGIGSYALNETLVDKLPAQQGADEFIEEVINRNPPIDEIFWGG